MTISLYISKHADAELFAYFHCFPFKKSTFIKEVLKDYLCQTHRARPQMLSMTYEEYLALPEKSLVIPITISSRHEQELIDFLEDCPRGMKSSCIKSLLKGALAPFSQSIYHTGRTHLPDISQEMDTGLRQQDVGTLAILSALNQITEHLAARPVPATPVVTAPPVAMPFAEPSDTVTEPETSTIADNEHTMGDNRQELPKKETETDSIQKTEHF